jgi:hypothetical protein
MCLALAEFFGGLAARKNRLSGAMGEPNVLRFGQRVHAHVCPKFGENNVGLATGEANIRGDIFRVHSEAGSRHPITSRYDPRA